MKLWAVMMDNGRGDHVVTFIQDETAEAALMRARVLVEHDGAFCYLNAHDPANAVSVIELDLHTDPLVLGVDHEVADPWASMDRILARKTVE